jgi:SAM-dependent methyltransferase
MIDTLRHNTGFDDPDPWVEYAITHAFRRVKSTKIPVCPDCGGEPHRSVTQFVYYSTLMHLLQCGSCGLVWADAHLDPEVTRKHFEVSYKDEAYFQEGRKAIYEQLTGHVVRLTGPGARVLDIGGAKGHLMHRVVRYRPDLRVTVYDVSRAATTWAADTHGFETICGDVHDLLRHALQYDVVVLSDVMYYEPNLPLLWSAISRLVSPTGAVLIRVPNKLWYIKVRQLALALWQPTRRRALQSVAPGFNPEHLYIFQRKYLVHRLHGIGFSAIGVLPSPPLGSSRIARVVWDGYFRLAQIANVLSRSKVVLTPAMLVVGRRRESQPPRRDP